MRDQDNAPCHLVKERLRELCREGRRSDALIRIVCRELESWFLGETRAVATAMDAPRVAELRAKEMFRDPDRLGTPSAKLADLIPGYGKVGGARRIGAVFDSDRCVSESFRQLSAGWSVL